MAMVMGSDGEWVRSRGWGFHALALGCYVGLALIATFPLVLHVGDRFIGNQPGSVDGFLGIWNVWWTAQAVRDGRSPFFTPLLFYPDGLDLFWQTLSVPQTLLAVPITWLFGPLAAYNVLVLASFVFGGYAAFLFVRRFVDDECAALVAGAMYCLAPFHLQKVLDAQLEVAAIEWVPLYVLVLHGLLERPRWGRALGAGVLLVWVGLGTWYYGLFCLIYTGLAALVWGVGVRGWGARVGRWVWGMVPLVVWGVVLAPRLWSLAHSGDRLLGDARVFNAASSADLIAFWLPSPLHPLWGQAISAFYLRLHPQALLWNVSFGLVASGLALVGGLMTWRATWRWLVLLVATMVLAMGEQLSVWGVETGIPLPYAWLSGLPGIRSSHRPNHMVVLSILLVALLAAYGVQVVVRRYASRRGLVTVVLVGAVLLIDGWMGPLPLVAREVPAAYRMLPPPDGGAILPIPINLNVSRSENLWYQTVHGWPIVGGFIGREPPYVLGAFAPGVRDLRFGRPQREDILTPGWPVLGREGLSAYGVRFVVFHPDTMRETLAPMRLLMGELGLRPSYGDGGAEVYPVPPVSHPRPLVFLGEGWGQVEEDGGRRWRWMGERADVFVVNPFSERRVVALDVAMEAYVHGRVLTLLLDGEPFGTLAVSRAAMRRRVLLVLGPGQHVVQLSAPAEEGVDRSHRRLSVAFFGIQVHDGSGP